MFHTVFDQTERRVDDSAHGVVAHRRAEVELPVALMPVEPVAIVMVGVGAGRRRDRLGGRMDGVVVKRSEHQFCFCLTAPAAVTPRGAR